MFSFAEFCLAFSKSYVEIKPIPKTYKIMFVNNNIKNLFFVETTPNLYYNINVTI
mgnify:CR=1 FL=1|jgi:hypothetical protein